MLLILALSVIILQNVRSYSCRSVTGALDNTNVKSAEDSSETYDLRSEEMLELLQPFLEPNSKATGYQQIQKNLAKLTIEPYLERNSTNPHWIKSPYNSINTRKKTIAPLAIILTNLADVKHKLARNKNRTNVDETQKDIENIIVAGTTPSVVQYYPTKLNTKQNIPMEVIDANGQRSYYLNLEGKKYKTVQSDRSISKPVPNFIPVTLSTLQNVITEGNKLENKFENSSVKYEKNEKAYTEIPFTGNLTNSSEPFSTTGSKYFNEYHDTKIDDINNINSALFDILTKNRTIQEDNENKSEYSKNWQVSEDIGLQKKKRPDFEFQYDSLDLDKSKEAENDEKTQTIQIPNKIIIDTNKNNNTEQPMHTTVEIDGDDSITFNNDYDLNENLGIDSTENYYQSTSQEKVEENHEELSKQADWKFFLDLPAKNSSESFNFISEKDIVAEELSGNINDIYLRDFSSDRQPQEPLKQTDHHPEAINKKDIITIYTAPHIAEDRISLELDNDLNKHEFVKKDSSDQNELIIEQDMIVSTLNNEPNGIQKFENLVNDKESSKGCRHANNFYTNKTYNLSFLFNR